MKKAFLAFALLVAIPAVSFAADPMFEEEVEDEDRPTKVGVFLYPFAEDYKWREFWEGGLVQEESGDLYGGGLVATFESGTSIYRLKGEYFRGTLDAEGTSGGLAWSTDVKLYGIRAEVDGGWRIPLGRVSVIPQMGIGYRWWRREYQASATINATQDKWHTAYFKIGAAAEYDLGAGIVPYVEGALRIHVFNNDEIDYYGSRVSLNPGGRITTYAEAGLKLVVLKGAVYYERLEFAQSAPALAPGLPPGWGLVYPEVKTNIFGARVGVAF